MKFRNLLIGAVAAALSMAAVTASAYDRVRTQVGVYVGPPVVWSSPWGPGWGPAWGPYGYPPAYYPPPVVVVQPQQPPPVYVEKNEPRGEADPAQWYYCKSGKGYYPYVKECPEGWQKVLPQPEK